MKENFKIYLPYKFHWRAHSVGGVPQLSHKKMKTLFFSNMSKSRRLTSTFFPTILEKKSFLFENKFIYWHKNECISIENPCIFSVSPLWLNHSRHSSGKHFVELFEVLWSDGTPDHLRHFLLLRLDLKL